MNREDLKALGLTEEQIEKVMASHGKVINPLKSEADRVKDLENEITTYKQQIADRDTQLVDLSRKVGDNKDLQNQIKDLQKANADAKEESDSKLAAQRKEFKLELALKDAAAKNPKAVKALLDQEKISLDGDNLIGLDEQLKSLKESDAYLFGEDEPSGLKGRQPHPSEPNRPTPQNNPFSKEHFNLTEQGRLLKDDPELYKKFKASAK
ncbi:phage scaffolding protein [Cytobacillus sp. FSL R5-0569]|uniref:phage scaffolding protein n=1 Tax=unclassified Cytobacillus TaxID=2675268 RepID=UPI0030F55B95